MANQVSQSRKCILHIGMQKTASTSIQRSLYTNLRDKNYYYGEFGANHGSVIGTLLFKKPSNIAKFKRIGLSKKAFLKKKEQYGKTLPRSFSMCGESQTYILSSENLFALNRDQLSALKNLLNTRFEEVIIVAYVRSPKSYIESRFQQHVKKTVRTLAELDVLYPKYRKMFEKFDDIFGKNNVKLWKFDPKTFKNGCAVQDFCSRVGIDFSPEQVVTMNEGLSLDAISILYAYRKYYRVETGKEITRQHKALVECLSVIKSGKVRLATPLIKPVLDKNSKDIAWMEQRLGDSLQEDFAFDPPDAVAHEDDLLSLSVMAAPRLLEIVPPGVVPEDFEFRTPEDVALLLEKWRQTL